MLEKKWVWLPLAFISEGYFFVWEFPMNLKKDVRSYLKSLPSSLFFNHATHRNGIVGGIKGRLTFFMVIDTHRNLSIVELKFLEKIKRCEGEAFVIRSLDDLCEIAKIRGWFDV